MYCKKQCKGRKIIMNDFRQTWSQFSCLQFIIMYIPLFKLEISYCQPKYSIWHSESKAAQRISAANYFLMIKLVLTIAICSSWFHMYLRLWISNLPRIRNVDCQLADSALREALTGMGKQLIGVGTWHEAASCSDICYCSGKDDLASSSLLWSFSQWFDSVFCTEHLLELTCFFWIQVGFLFLFCRWVTESDSYSILALWTLELSRDWEAYEEVLSSKTALSKDTKEEGKGERKRELKQ